MIKRKAVVLNSSKETDLHRCGGTPMDALIGTVIDVKQSVSGNWTDLASGYTFAECGLQFIGDEVKFFTKSDLKTGMVVQMRNGRKFIVLLDGVTDKILVGKETWTGLHHYDEDLTAKYKYSGGDTDIDKVYQDTNGCLFSVSESYLIWSRP